MAVDAALKTQNKYERELPVCLDNPDAWFGGILSNNVRYTYADHMALVSQQGDVNIDLVPENYLPRQPSAEQEFLDKETEAEIDTITSAKDECEFHEALLTAWSHVQALNAALKAIPENKRQWRTLVTGAADFYKERLDKVCPGLGGQLDCELARKMISGVKRTANCGLPEAKGELYMFLLTKWPAWERMEQEQARGNYDSQKSILRKRYNISLNAFGEAIGQEV
jgi:hypothetical protein